MGLAGGFCAEESLTRSQNLAFFAEYRFTHVAPTFRPEVSGTTREVETTFNTHSIVVGASFRF